MQSKTHCTGAERETNQYPPCTWNAARIPPGVNHVFCLKCYVIMRHNTNILNSTMYRLPSNLRTAIIMFLLPLRANSSSAEIHRVVQQNSAITKGRVTENLFQD
jgi:hypothetical protein